MNLGQLRDQILYYYESPDDLTAAFVTRAINAARKAAEQRYAFEMNKKILQASVDARTGALWTSLPLMGTTTPLLRVRSLKRAYLVGEDGLGMTEIPFVYRGLLQYSTIDPIPISTSTTGRSLFIVGDTVYFHPFGAGGTLSPMLFDAHIWMTEYPEGVKTTELETTDWMLEHGYDYLFWKSVWHLNFKKKEWVARQEGNLQLSTENAETEFQNLVRWDAALKAGMTSLNENM